jgi:hypothetical protein
MKNQIMTATSKLDSVLGKVFSLIPKSSSPTPTAKTTVITSTPKPGFFKQSFRGKNRLSIEAYMSATSDADKDAALENYKEV